MPAESNGLMERLRSETRAHHDAAENQALQKALVAGELGRETYVRYLGQMLLVHRALEPRIRALIDSRAELGQAIHDDNFREDDLVADLKTFGTDPADESLKPCAATAALIADIERLAQTRPVALVGMHYVLEGANNGNRFIARAMAKALQLTDGNGVRYLDPYGESQRERWQAYKTAMSGVTVDPAESDAIVDAAKRMFEAIGAISQEIARTSDEQVAAAAAQATRT